MKSDHAYDVIYLLEKYIVYRSVVDRVMCPFPFPFPEFVFP